jgi:hypothetical protein
MSFRSSRAATRATALLCCLIGSLAVPAGRARAAVVLDQQNVFPNPSIGDSSNAGSIEYGQTFTVGVAGTLAQVDVYVARFSPTTDNLVFRLYSTTGGVPSAQLGTDLTLAPTDVSSTTPDFESFDVSAFSVSVNVGDVLAFAVTTSTNFSSFGYILPFSTTQLYAGGQPVSRVMNAPPDPWQAATGVTRDYAFRTYVDAVPEPSALAMLSLIAGATLRRRGNRRRGH